MAKLVGLCDMIGIASDNESKREQSEKIIEILATPGFDPGSSGL